MEIILPAPTPAPIKGTSAAAPSGKDLGIEVSISGAATTTSPSGVTAAATPPLATGAVGLLGGESSTITHEDQVNMKRAVNMLNRIEKTLVPEMAHNPYSERFSELCKKASRGEYLRSIEIHRATGVVLRDIDWVIVEEDIIAAFAENASSPDEKLPPNARAEINLEKKKQVQSYLIVHKS